MIDLDPQGNATMGSGIDKRRLEQTVYDVLLESASVAEAPREIREVATKFWVPTANSPARRSRWWRSSGGKSV
jgi:cellulose biosynthesis protein BcsQ